MCRNHAARGTRKAPTIPILFTAILLCCSCATMEKRPVAEPLSEQEVAAAVATMKEQERLVTSLVAGGKLTIKNWYWEAETDVLLVGTKEPLQVKVEIVHTWGQPILHILVHEGRLEALSFGDQKLFISPFTPKALSRFFPGDLDPLLIWTVLRGYPGLRAHSRAISAKAHQVKLLDSEGREVEVVDLHPGTHLPRRATFPDRRITLEFSEFRERDGVLYATKVDIDPSEGEKKVGLDIDQMVPNRRIPKDVFELQVPPTFQIQRLDEVRPK